MKKVRGAQIVTRMDWAGSPDIIRIICASLKQDGYDVKLITGPTKNFSAGTKNFLEEFKNDIIVIPWLRREANLFLDSLSLMKLYLILLKEKFDIVHTHTAKAGALGRVAAYLAGCRRIVHMPHGHNFYGYFSPFISMLVKRLERFLARFTDGFVALSDLEKEDLLKFGIAEDKRIRVVPSGMNLQFKGIDRVEALRKKEELGFRLDERIVGMVSRLEEVKGPEYFIEAAEMVARRTEGVRFLVAGEGSLRRKLENRVKELGLGDTVIFTGWRDDALEIISFLDILVQPSLNEAVGRVLLEAQGLGIPVVATKVGGIAEVVKEDVTGILVPSRDTEELADAICGLLEDEGKMSSMSKSARKWVDEKFSVEMMLKEINSVYKEVSRI